MKIRVRDGKGSKERYTKKFFIPVKVLSRKFRGKFLYYLNKLYLDNKLKIPDSISELNAKNIFNQFKDSLYKKEWVVYSKAPFASAEYVLQYLGRYTHRVAISNNRILKVDNEKVIFKWRDYRDRNKKLKFKRCIEIFRIKTKEDDNLSSAELFFKLTGIEIGKCKHCEKGKLIKIKKVMPRIASPP